MATKEVVLMVVEGRKLRRALATSNTTGTGNGTKAIWKRIMFSEAPQ